MFLSAGLDSALVTALAQRASARPLRSFTLAFDSFRGPDLDEAVGAAELARTGTGHTERRVSQAELEALWRDALNAMEGLEAYDPLADIRASTSSARDHWACWRRAAVRLYLRDPLLRDADWAPMAHWPELRVSPVDAPLCLALGAGQVRARPHLRQGRPRSTGRTGAPASLLEQVGSGFMIPAALAPRRRRPGFGERGA